MRPPFAVLAALLGLCAITLSPLDGAAAAAAPFPDVSSRFDRDSVDLKGLIDQTPRDQSDKSDESGTDGTVSNAGGSSQGRAEQPSSVSRLLPACGGENPNLGLVNECATQPSTICPPGERLFFNWVADAVNGVADGEYVQQGSVCVGPDQAEDLAPADGAEPVVLPVMTQADFQRLPLPAGISTIQPSSGDVLLTVPTNTYAVAEPVEIPTELLGFPVTVRATPAAYTWDYGDGTVIGPTEDPGAPYPDMRITHAYQVPGHYEITLTTHYTGEYSVLGGPYLPIPGEAQVDSDPQPVVTYQGPNAPVADLLE